MPFLDQLNHWARHQPGATAVEVGADRLSFAGLAARATDALSVGTDGAGIGVLSLPNGIDFAVALAAGIAGDRAVAVLDPGWPDAQRHAVTERLAAEGVRRQAQPRPDSVPSLADGHPDSVFLYGFTSGTTSVPKAFTRTRGSWRRSFEAGTDYFGLTGHDRTLAPGPLSSSLTLYALAESLHAGATFVTLPEFDLAAALACVADRGITRLVLVPTVLRMLSERGLAGGVDGRTLTSIVSAGARLDPATLAAARRFAPNATIHEYYGAAELSFIAASGLRPGDSPGANATAVGRAFPGVSLAIRDEAGRELPRNEPGTIFVRSDLVSTGYAWGDDGEAFRRDGDWCTVGDLGFLDRDDVLHFLNRRADMIVTAGQNIYPQEVEAALQELPGVASVVAVGVPDARRGSKLVVAVLAGPEVDAAALRRASAAALAEAKRPRSFYRLAALPLAPTGKLSRDLLARWITEGDPRVTALD
ncbi:class I adenylate-forming enzyme family protein [Cryobacterium fucosi]|uniref:Long-chain fatty acid--CoA ligase n=1 Tax=Cryobacterium fucosi TaxID=1259157 RepID=A0A4R9B3B9_9MICO|nr:AMP-binding protein [Cryobacterium fucosi]TFD74799.1 long-chain fatty acid--CoA ligase [Cryobacterium fucosi]